MRLQKQTNRIVKGKTYEKWVVVLPPALIRVLGWDETTELSATQYGGKELRLRPVE